MWFGLRLQMQIADQNMQKECLKQAFEKRQTNKNQQTNKQKNKKNKIRQANKSLPHLP